MMKKTVGAEHPVIFWASDPVGPNETVMLSGHLLGEGSNVELVRLDDGDAAAPDWSRAIAPAVPLRDGQSLAAVIPADWAPGLYACRVRRGDALSNVVVLNEPAAWWFQGDCGLNTASAGGWLRVFGKTLQGQGATPRLRLVPAAGGAAVEPDLRAVSRYSLEAALPATLTPGAWRVEAHNGHGGAAGWLPAGTLAVRAPAPVRGPVLSILDFGADPEGLKNSTLPIVQTIENLLGAGGGTVLIPRGRYRVDSNLRSGTFIQTPLVLPQHIALKGEGMDVTTLWWPDRAEPLPTLIECIGDNAIEDLAIYTQGRHRNIITSDGNDIAVRRVRIRANCYYMTSEGGRAHHRRGVPEEAGKMGMACEFNGGRNIEVADCDILSSAAAFSLKHLVGARVAGNTVRSSSLMFVSGGEGQIIENNVFTGNSLTAGGSNVALHFGARRCSHVYFAHNRVAQIFGGDHEALTLDGHGTGYLGGVARVEGTRLTLAADPVLGLDGIRDPMLSLDKATLYVLAGRGRGQYRHLLANQGRTLTLEAPFAVDPDADSVVSLGGFNGRHLFIGNTTEDAGPALQLYPPNCECIVAGHRAIRCASFNSCSKLGRNTGSRFHRVEPSWYNQFLDNHVLVGNGWGGGETEIDRWLGGEGCLLIWGWQVRFGVDKEGCDQDAQLTEEDLALLLGRPNPFPGQPLPLSLFQIVRRHLIDNNHSIRIRGAVSGALVEGCVIRAARRGIRVDNEVVKTHVEDLGQLVFEPPQHQPAPGEPPPFLSPRNVVIRGNRFEDVREPVCGTALQWATIVKEARA
jgi:hypothetical protein